GLLPVRQTGSSDIHETGSDILGRPEDTRWLVHSGQVTASEAWPPGATATDQNDHDDQIERIERNACPALVGGRRRRPRAGCSLWPSCPPPPSRGQASLDVESRDRRLELRAVTRCSTHCGGPSTLRAGARAAGAERRRARLRAAGRAASRNHVPSRLSD